MQNTPINDALNKLGLGNATMQRNRFFRSDDPPTNVIFQSSQIIEPKFDHTQNENILFPYKMDNSMVFTKGELLKLQEANLKQLLDYYKKQLDQIDRIAEGNKSAINKADLLIKRKHFYYCYLTSLINSPLNASFANLNQLIALRKLFINRNFKISKKRIIAEQCCKEPNCPQIAICGSSYCGWHILKDPNQHLYKKCPVCGWPCLINNFMPCQIHRGKSKVQKKSATND